MFFDEQPRDLPRSFAPGNPATLTDVWNTSRESQQKIHNDFAISNQIEDEYDLRIDAIEKATGKRLANPYTSPVTADEYAEIARITKDDPSKPAVFVPKWRAEKFEQRLRELAAEYPNAASAIGVDKPPSAIIHERLSAVEKRQAETREGYGFADPTQIPVIGGIPVVGALAGIVKDTATKPLGMAATLGGTVSAWFRMPTLDNPSPLATFTDPATALFGLGASKGMSLVKTTLRAAAANMAQQAAIEPSLQMQRSRAGLDYGLEQSATNIAGAGVLGGLLDAGVRAPVRVGRRLAGDTEVGGVLHDYKKPSPPAADVVARALDGDVDAARGVADSLGLTEDPAFRGALDHVEMHAPLDADAAATLRSMGVDTGDGLRTLLQAMKAAADPDEVPPVRAPDALSEPATALLTREADALLAAHGRDVDTLLQAAAPYLNRVDPRLTRAINDAVAVGFAEVLPIARAAAEAIARGEDADGVAKGFSVAIGKAVQDIGPDTFVARAAIHGGRGTPVEIAQYIRGGVAIDASMPLGSEVMHIARSVATLSDEAFRMVAADEAPAVLGSLVADRVADPQLQAPVLRSLVEAKPQTAEQAGRVLADLLPSKSRETNRSLLGVRSDADTAELPLRAGAEVEDPTAKGTKAQRERLAQELAPEIKYAMAEGPLPPDPVHNAAEAMARAQAVQSAIEDVAGGPMPIIPPEASVRTFASPADLPAELQGDMARAAGVAFTDAFKRFRAAETVEARAAARAELDAVQAGYGIEALSQGDVIYLASYAIEPHGRLAHEAVHVLRTLGKLSPKEIKLLADRGRADGAFHTARESLYRAELEARGYDAKRIGELLDEEAAAHLIEARMRGGQFGKRIDTVIDRLRLFMEKVGNALRLRGFKTADDVVEAVLSGEAAKRHGLQAWMRQDDFATATSGPQGSITDISEPGSRPPVAAETLYKNATQGGWKPSRPAASTRADLSQVSLDGAAQDLVIRAAVADPTARKALVDTYGQAIADALVADTQNVIAVSSGKVRTFQEVKEYLAGRFGVEEPTFTGGVDGMGRGNYEAVVGGKSVGRAYARDVGDNIQLGQLNVDAPYQRQGIGTKLQQHIEKDMGKRAIPDAFMSNAEYNRWKKNDPATVANYKQTPDGNWTGTPGLPSSPVGAGGKVEPPAPGMVRVYHGGSTPDDYNGPLWFTTQQSYAEGYAGKSSAGRVHYLDLPESHPMFATDYPEQGVRQGFTFAAELPAHEIGGRKVLPSQAQEAGRAIQPLPEGMPRGRKGNDPLFALPELDPETLSLLISRATEARETAAGPKGEARLERGPDGSVVALIKDGVRKEFTRGKGGEITGTRDIGQVEPGHADLSGLTDLLQTEVAERYGLDLSPEAASALAHQIVEAVSGGPENHSAMAAAMSDFLTHRLAGMNDGEVAAAAGSAPAARLPATPLRRDLGAVQRLTEIKNIAEACRA